MGQFTINSSLIENYVMLAIWRHWQCQIWKFPNSSPNIAQVFPNVFFCQTFSRSSSVMRAVVCCVLYCVSFILFFDESIEATSVYFWPMHLWMSWSICWRTECHFYGEKKSIWKVLLGHSLHKAIFSSTMGAAILDWTAQPVKDLLNILVTHDWTL